MSKLINKPIIEKSEIITFTFLVTFADRYETIFTAKDICQLSDYLSRYYDIMNVISIENKTGYRDIAGYDYKDITDYMSM